MYITFFKLFLFVIIIFCLPLQVILADLPNSNPSAGVGDYESSEKGEINNNESSPTELLNPLTGQHDSPNINWIIGYIIKAILGIIGSITLLMFVYGGFLWMTAAGSSEKIQKGKNTIIWSVIGLAVIFASYAIVHFIINMFSGLG